MGRTTKRSTHAIISDGMKENAIASSPRLILTPAIAPPVVKIIFKFFFIYTPMLIN